MSEIGDDLVVVIQGAGLCCGDAATRTARFVRSSCVRWQDHSDQTKFASQQCACVAANFFYPCRAGERKSVVAGLQSERSFVFAFVIVHSFCSA